jgi:hypothetical protein
MKVTHCYKTDNNKFKTGSITRSKTIRLFCNECMGYQPYLVADCPSKNCVLFPYRKGPGKVDHSVEGDLESF